MEFFKQIKDDLKTKLMRPYWLFYPIKLDGLGDCHRPVQKDNCNLAQEERSVPVMAILQAGTAIDGTLIKGINALVDAKRQSHLIMQSKWSQQM